MRTNRSRTARTRARILRAAITLAVFVIVASIGALITRNRTVPPPPTSRLIGSWTMSSPQGPGTTRVLTFESDGRLTSVDLSDQSGIVLQDRVATWHVDGQMVVFRKHRPGIASLLDAIPGVGPPEERIPILSVSDDELLVGNPATPMTYKRATRNAPAIAR